MIASIRELRSSTREILSAVNRGDSVIITNRGKACAKIVPIDDKKQVGLSKEGYAYGMWKDNKKVSDVKKYIHSLRKGRYAR